MTELAIRTEGLTRRFGDIHALEDLSLTVPAGAVFGFLGPNGAGKTTTIRLLLGLLAPTAGRACVLGLDVTRDAERIRLRTGSLLEHAGLYERLTAEDNLEFYGRIWHLPGAERTGRIRALLEPLGLWERRHERVGTWSRGMKQKLAVARALLHRPALLFLDEPGAGLDPEATVAFRRDLTALVRSEGTTVFLTTHNLAEAEKLCTHLGIIRGGRLVGAGTPEELRAAGARTQLEVRGHALDGGLARRLLSRTEVEEASADDDAATLRLRLRAPLPTGTLVSMIQGAGGEVDEVRRVERSLEDAYMALMAQERECAD